MYGKIEKLFKMKRYLITYVPEERKDRPYPITEWAYIYAANEEAARMKAKDFGVLKEISLNEEK